MILADIKKKIQGIKFLNRIIIKVKYTFIKKKEPPEEPPEEAVESHPAPEPQPEPEPKPEPEPEPIVYHPVKVTILVCTPDMYSDFTATCIESVKKYTPPHIRYELLVFENGKFGSFQHPLEINRALEVALGDVVVTLDDDVEVTEGWLESMLELAEPDVGIVGCYQLNSKEALHEKSPVRHVGGWVDCEGNVYQHTEPIDKPINVPYVGSACCLINDRSFRFSLEYKKYYQELDLCLQSWEKGKRVVVSPVGIYHYGQGQMYNLGYTKADVLEASDSDRLVFKRIWSDSGRLLKVYNKIKKQIDIDFHYEVNQTEEP